VRAQVKVFRHNDMAHLEKLLRWHIAEGQPRTHRPWKKVRRLRLLFSTDADG
jgi:serine palmitoyltransferase